MITEEEQKFEYLKYIYSIVSSYDPENERLASIRDAIYNGTYIKLTENNFDRLHSNFTGGKFPRYDIKKFSEYFRDKKINSILDLPQDEL